MDRELLFVLAAAFLACASLFLRWRIQRDRARIGSLKLLGGMVEQLLELVAALEAKVKAAASERHALRNELDRVTLRARDQADTIAAQGAELERLHAELADRPTPV